MSDVVRVDRKILMLRGERVMLDEDLADLYGVDWLLIHFPTRLARCAG